jgi:TonB family protein
MIFLMYWSTVLFSAVVLFAGSFHAQDSPKQASPSLVAESGVAVPVYPDSTSGLEHLAKDIIKAQQENNGALADALIKSLVLPAPQAWYEHTFGKPAAAVGAYYEKSSSAVAPQLARLFLDFQARDLPNVQAHRFDDSCDDNAAEDTYGILLGRLDRVPLYELRFLKGDKFARMFPFAYVDGKFRFLISPNFKLPPATDNSAEHKPVPSDSRAHPAATMVRIGGNVQAAKLVNRVQPVYPSVAREERLQGTVSIRVVIAKDGGIREIQNVRGACSLAKSAVEAVRQWRYAPTLLSGNPVEVLTEITVTFELRQ